MPVADPHRLPVSIPSLYNYVLPLLIHLASQTSSFLLKLMHSHTVITARRDHLPQGKEYVSGFSYALEILLISILS